MWRYFLEGLLLGWGACIPLGPMNIEMIRRHLIHGLRYGLSFGIGASLSDLTYFVLVYFGLVQLISEHKTLRVIGMISIVVMILFGLSALRAKVEIPEDVAAELNTPRKEKKKTTAVFFHGVSGYFYTLVNPYTVIFWVTVGAQFATLRNTHTHVAIALGLGVVISTLTWVIFLNGLLIKVKKKITARWMRRVNLLGAACLFAFVLLIVFELFVSKNLH